MKQITQVIIIRRINTANDVLDAVSPPIPDDAAVVRHWVSEVGVDGSSVSKARDWHTVGVLHVLKL